jgi:hypothetical protein
MNDIEDRLRTTLHELADTVPPSPQARADLDHRLTRRGRRPLLVAAAAAVVVAAVAVPVVLNQGGGQVATPPVMTSTPPPTSEPGNLVKLGIVVGAEADKTAWLKVNADGTGWCFVETSPGAAPEFLECEATPDWATAQPPNSRVLTRAVLEDDHAPYSGPFPNMLLFITAPEVATLEVREAYGQPVRLNRVPGLAGGTMYLATFPETHAGFGYTAWDAAGNVLENAIT